MFFVPPAEADSESATAMDSDLGARGAAPPPQAAASAFEVWEIDSDATVLCAVDTPSFEDAADTIQRAGLDAGYADVTSIAGAGWVNLALTCCGSLSLTVTCSLVEPSVVVVFVWMICDVCCRGCAGCVLVPACRVTTSVRRADHWFLSTYSV
jgi:hypothetical protein